MDALEFIPMVERLGLREADMTYTRGRGGPTWLVCIGGG